MSASRIPEKILQGRRAPIPVVVAALYSPEAQRDDLVLQHQVPAKVLPAIGDARTRSQSILVVLNPRGCVGDGSMTLLTDLRAGVVDRAERVRPCTGRIVRP
jgi:hypothetical protein